MPASSAATAANAAINSSEKRVPVCARSTIESMVRTSVSNMLRSNFAIAARTCPAYFAGSPCVRRGQALVRHHSHNLEPLGLRSGEAHQDTLAHSATIGERLRRQRLVHNHAPGLRGVVALL